LATALFRAGFFGVAFFAAAGFDLATSDFFAAQRFLSD